MTKPEPFTQPFARNLSCGLLFLIVAFSHTHVLGAEKVFDYVPEDALGCVAFRNLEALDAKVQKFSELFEMPMPALLAFIQITTGFGEGFNTQGDVLLALLPGETLTSMPIPFVLIPVTDYAKFSESISGDQSGEICRVTIAGEDVLLAQKGTYAMLMNIENEETFVHLLQAAPAPVAALKPLDPWLVKNDVTITILPSGAKILFELGNQGLVEANKVSATQDENAEIFGSMQSVMAFYQSVLDFVSQEVEMASWGLSIDGEQNICLSKRVTLNKKSRISQAGAIRVDQSPIFSGFADQPFVVAGGGPIPENWATGLAKASSNMIRSMKAFYGLEDLSEDSWKDLEQSYTTMMQGLDSATMIMLPGEEKDPLFSNFYSVAGASNAEEYLDAYQEAAKTYSRIMSQSTHFNMEYVVEPKEIAGKPGCELSIDIASMMQDPNVPQFNWMLESMFGEDGKLHYFIVAADRKNLAISMGDPEKTTPLLADIENGETGLSRNKEVQMTMEHLPSTAPWKLLISPAGCVTWAERFANELLSNLTGQTMDFPEFPNSPPLGASLQIVDARIEGDLVWPAETLQALADYIKTCQEQ